MRFRHRLLAALIAMTLAAPVLPADDLPELGDIAGSELSIATEKKIGLEIMNEIRWRDPSYLDDPDIESYLNQLGNQLAAAGNEPGFGYFFFTINDPSINAFAMPGGYIGVHTGLILAAQSESELAGVLAHEISHVSQRHIARQVFQSSRVSMASMLAMGLALLAARSSTQLAGAAAATAQGGALQAQLAFSRDYEREADRVGFETLRKAGYDVRGMSAFFGRLQKAARLYENKATAYLRTHPLSGERMADMQNREQTQPYRQVPDSVDFQLVRAKLRAQQGVAVDAISDFREQLRDGKYSSEAAAHFGMAIALGRARDWNGAEQELQSARKLRISSPILERQLAEVRLARGDVSGALQLYREAMQRYPLNAALNYGYAHALISSGRFADSLRFVDGLLAATPQDIRLNKLRVESYAGLGRRTQQHQAQAEVLALQGQTLAAIEQLQLAQRAGDGSFYEMSVVDTRLRQLKQRHLEEQKERRN